MKCLFCLREMGEVKNEGWSTESEGRRGKVWVCLCGQKAIESPIDQSKCIKVRWPPRDK